MSLPSWATDLLAQTDDQTRLAILLLLIAGAIWFLVPGKAKPKASPRDDIEARRPSNEPLWRRLWWRIRPPGDLMRVGGLTLNRSRRPHAAWLGPTGAGKSSAVAVVRLDGKRPTLIVTPDVSDPMRAATMGLNGFIWTACESRIPVNFLIGEPTEVAERLTEVFRSGGVGAWKRAARRATASVVRDLDASRQPRTLHAIGHALAEAVKHDRDLRTVCAGWVDRFLDLADQFGGSIGPEGLDLADLLNSGRTILLEVDAFDHPGLGMDVVALGLAEAKRCASRVSGGFRLIFEEAGQLGERIDLAEPFFRAGRRRKIATDVLTQVESDLNDAISANVATRVYFAQDMRSAQRAAAERLGVDHKALDPASMADFTAWISHGRVRRLVRFPKPPVSRGAPSQSEFRTQEKGTARRVVIRELDTPREVLPALPPPTGLNAVIAAGIYRDGECERWRGDHNDRGYGRVRMPDGTRVYIHRLRWELAYGPIPLAENGMRMTIDHLSGVCLYKDCSRIEHLELVTRGENSKRRWRIRGS